MAEQNFSKHRLKFEYKNVCLIVLICYLHTVINDNTILVLNKPLDRLSKYWCFLFNMTGGLINK